MNTPTFLFISHGPRPPSHAGLGLRHLGLSLAALLTVGSNALSGAEPAATSQAKPAPPAAAESEWQTLFDGKSLAGWKITDFAGHGEVAVEKGEIRLGMGAMLTGVIYTNPVPKTDYEVSLEAMKLSGSDFFCGLTVPVADSHCSFIVGGWGGGVVGVSSIDGMDASENQTTRYQSFEKDRWYHVRFRVTKHKLEAWIDEDKMVNQSIEGRRISLRPGEIELSVPFGIASYQTSAALRNIKLRPVKTAAP